MSVQRQGLTALAKNRAGLASGRTLVELFQDPARLLMQESLNLAPGRAHWRGDREPVFIHFDADGAPVPALEAEFNRAPLEQRVARRRRVRRRRFVEQR